MAVCETCGSTEFYKSGLCAVCSTEREQNEAAMRCTCDLQDSPTAPADWHGESCPLYVKPEPAPDTMITCLVCGKYHSIYRACWKEA